MRPTSTRLLQVAACVASLISVSLAWPGSLPEADSLVIRADEDSSSETITDPPPSATGSGNSDGDQTDVDLNTAKADTETGTKTGTQTTGRNGEPTHTSFRFDTPPGGVSIQTPGITAGVTPLYKIGDYVTWGWNYTSLQGTPTAVDVLLSCSYNSQTWTLTQNMTFETDVTYVWNTKDQEDSAESPLLTEMYTLLIKDSDIDVTAAPEPGYLSTYNQFQFGLYKKQEYKPLDEWECTGCNGAIPGIDTQALAFALSMSLVTIMSFTWFVTGLGLH